MATQQEEIKQFYASYLDAFHSGEAKAVVSFYHMPCLFIVDQGVTLLASEPEAENFFAQVIEGLKGKNYGHSEVFDVQIKELSGDMALFSGLAKRYTKAGEEFERLSATYTMRKSNNAWQFVSVVAHSPETLVRFG